jgi:hypothetical protein
MRAVHGGGESFRHEVIKQPVRDVRFVVHPTGQRKETKEHRFEARFPVSPNCHTPPEPSGAPAPPPRRSAASFTIKMLISEGLTPLMRLA